MRESEPLPEQPGLTPRDVCFILSRHKWMILLCAAAGILAAIGFYIVMPPRYESQAKLLVRYVMERSAIDMADSQSKPAAAYGGDAVINSEVEILNSQDLASEVVDALGPEHLLPSTKGEATKSEATRTVRSGLKVVAPPASKVISLSYKNHDPKLATEILNELVSRYFVKHLEVHRSVGAFEFVSRQTEQVKERLQQTEAELKELKEKAGITSLTESTATLNVKLEKSQDQYNEALVEQAEQRARVMALESNVSGGADIPGLLPVNRSDAQRYQSLKLRLADARQKEVDLLSKFTPENRLVKLNQLQIADMENQRRDLEMKLPALASMGPAVKPSLSPQTDIVVEKARLASLDAKTEILADQLHRLQETARQLSEVGPQIAQLERRKEQEENNYKYFEASLSKARIDEALDPTKIPNISVIQSPSPALLDTKLLTKIVAGLAGGGIAFGIALAFLIELILDRTVKRPLELETALGAPVLISIPYLPIKNNLALGSADKSKELRVRKPSRHKKTSSIQPFFEAVRDRLVLYFELNRMRHKPKLVAVTGLSNGAGTSTVAAGLAAALSETGDGKVLLVNMNNADPEVHPFFQGQPAPHLSEALIDGYRNPSDNRTLYLATVGPRDDGTTSAAAKRFHELMPDLKASDFDYIIFDMPPINRTSATMAMSGFMDKVLLVVEAEKNDREHVKRAFKELVATKTDVSAVFNKSRHNDPD